MTDRSKVRMEKLRQQELEQLQWDQDALVLPEVLDRALLLSFESVKTEFSDLDGLSWPRPAPPVSTVEQPTPKLACAEIDGPARPSEPAQDTVRASRPSTRSPLQPANQCFPTPSHARPPLSCHGLRHS